MPERFFLQKGRNYTDADALDIVTLESAVYLGMKNDVAFLVDTRLYLCEHQSTYNPNIPLRNLFYIASEYQVLVKDKSLYTGRAGSGAEGDDVKHQRGA